MNRIWKTSVEELLTIFRGALISITPWLEKARIKWKQGESYDDWDNIATTLFENIVCNSLISETMPKYSIAKYDFTYDCYSNLDYILAKSKKYIDKSLVFVSFQSQNSPLDIVKVAVIDKQEFVNEYLTFKMKELSFAFVNNVEEKKKIITHIDVKL